MTCLDRKVSSLWMLRNEQRYRINGRVSCVFTYVRFLGLLNYEIQRAVLLAY